MEQFKEFMLTAWEWLNQPLPIISVSVLFLLVFAWKVFKSTKFGKKQLVAMERKIANSEEKLEIKKQELEVLKQQIIAKNKELEEKLEKVDEFIIKLCNTIPNRKVKELVKEIKDGEE